LASRHPLWLISLLLLLIAAGSLLGVVVGVSNLSPMTALNIIGDNYLGLDIATSWQQAQQVIVTQLRLPRVLLAILAGAGLAVCGAALQAATRNPLTDPFLLGVSSGASLGAVFVITKLGLVLGALTLPLLSFAGGLLSFAMLLLIMHQPQNQTPERMVLGGVAVSFFLMAGTNTLIFMGDQRAAQSVVFWMLGGLGRARWDLLAIPSAVILIGISLLCMQARSLNALLLGQESAISMGIDVQRKRRTILLLATLVTSVIVSLTGTIGFVGLVVPHLVRAMVGADNRWVLPISALAGAAFLLAMDLVSRVLLAPQELPIGILTGAVGGCYFCYLLLKREY